jgi:hypothetical protein
METELVKCDWCRKMVFPLMRKCPFCGRDSRATKNGFCGVKRAKVSPPLITTSSLC